MVDMTGLGSIFEFGTTLLNRLWPDASEVDQRKLTQFVAELDAEVKLRMAQLEVNKAEASNPNVFVSGARPALLWCCVFIFFYSYIVYPTAVFIVTLCAPDIVVPKLALDEAVWNLIFGLLGLGLIGARSYEKVKGVAR